MIRQSIVGTTASASASQTLSSSTPKLAKEMRRTGRDRTGPRHDGVRNVAKGAPQQDGSCFVESMAVARRVDELHGTSGWSAARGLLPARSPSHFGGDDKTTTSPPPPSTSSRAQRVRRPGPCGPSPRGGGVPSENGLVMTQHKLDNTTKSARAFSEGRPSKPNAQTVTSD